MLMFIGNLSVYACLENHSYFRNFKLVEIVILLVFYYGYDPFSLILVAICVQGATFYGIIQLRCSLTEDSTSSSEQIEGRNLCLLSFGTLFVAAEGWTFLLYLNVTLPFWCMKHVMVMLWDYIVEVSKFWTFHIMLWDYLVHITNRQLNLIIFTRCLGTLSCVCFRFAETWSPTICLAHDPVLWH